MVRINKKYQYKKHNRFQSETGRKYLVDEAPVPSVTTILSATKNSKGLDDWRRRVGNEEADRIMKNASSVGTEMHKVLEFYYNNELSKEALKICRLVAELGKNLGTDWDNTK